MNPFSVAFSILHDFYFSLPEWLQLDLIFEAFVFFFFSFFFRSLIRFLNNVEVSDDA